MLGIRKIPTPFKGDVSKKSKRTRIRIPQPIRTRASVSGDSALKRDELGGTPDWLTIHRRGVYREEIGTDALERRAVSRNQVRGTLPERIVYKWLVDNLHMQEGYYENASADFDFQSSQVGGRTELGGLVADFLFPRLKIVINVQGPTHSGFLRYRKDEEQKDILADMGYTSYDLELDEIYDAMRFENRMRRIFNLASGVGGASGMTSDEDVTNEDSTTVMLIDEILAETRGIMQQLEDISRGYLT